MLIVKIGTQRRKIGTLEIVQRQRLKSGSYRYDVTYKAASIRVESKVSHRRPEGALRLVQRACSVVSKRIRAYYSIPQDKIRVLGGPDNCVTLWDEHDEAGNETGAMSWPVMGMKYCDVPERYKKELGKHLGVHTATSLEGESVVYMSDLEGFINKMVAGIQPMFD